MYKLTYLLTCLWVRCVLMWLSECVMWLQVSQKGATQHARQDLTAHRTEHVSNVDSVRLISAAAAQSERACLSVCRGGLGWGGRLRYARRRSRSVRGTSRTDSIWAPRRCRHSRSTWHTTWRPHAPHAPLALPRLQRNDISARFLTPALQASRYRGTLHHGSVSTAANFYSRHEHTDNMTCF